MSKLGFQKFSHFGQNTHPPPPWKFGLHLGFDFLVGQNNLIAVSTKDTRLIFMASVCFQGSYLFSRREHPR